MTLNETTDFLFVCNVSPFFPFEWEISCFVNRMRDILSFELGNEIEKGIFRLVTSVGQRQKFFRKKF